MWCRYVNIFTQKILAGVELSEYEVDPLNALTTELREAFWLLCKVRDRFRL